MSAAEIAADFDEIDPKIAADFEPVDPAARIIGLMVRGRGRRAAAEEVGTSLFGGHALVAEWVRERSGEAGTYREGIAVVHAGIDDVIARAYSALDGALHVSDRAPLLEILLSALRFRAALLAAAKGGPRPKAAES